MFEKEKQLVQLKPKQKLMNFQMIFYLMEILISLVIVILAFYNI